MKAGRALVTRREFIEMCEAGEVPVASTLNLAALNTVAFINGARIITAAEVRGVSSMGPGFPVGNACPTYQQIVTGGQVLGPLYVGVTVEDPGAYTTADGAIAVTVVDGADVTVASLRSEVHAAQFSTQLSLPTGAYTVIVDAPGFQTVVGRKTVLSDGSMDTAAYRLTSTAQRADLLLTASWYAPPGSPRSLVAVAGPTAQPGTVFTVPAGRVLNLYDLNVTSGNITQLGPGATFTLSVLRADGTAAYQFGAGRSAVTRVRGRDAPALSLPAGATLRARFDVSSSASSDGSAQVRATGWLDPA